MMKLKSTLETIQFLNEQINLGLNKHVQKNFKKKDAIDNMPMYLKPKDILKYIEANSSIFAALDRHSVRYTKDYKGNKYLWLKGSVYCSNSDGSGTYHISVEIKNISENNIDLEIRIWTSSGYSNEDYIDINGDLNDLDSIVDKVDKEINDLYFDGVFYTYFH